MESLKIKYCDFWPEWEQENFITPILKKYFIIEPNSSNPDVVFHSIFGGNQSSSYNCKKILFLGENRRPSSFKTNYSISFDPHSETNYHLPLWQVFLLLQPELKDVLFSRNNNHKSFDEFCSFTVSNPSNFVRNGFYNLMKSKFGTIKSYGRYMNNDNSLQKISTNNYWRTAKYNFFLQKKHKYSIAFENTSYPYYTTEKLMDAFLAGSLPIYWGDPYIKEDWNAEAFINVGKLGNDETINKIKNLESNTNLFNDIYNAPVFTDKQKQKHIDNMNNFESWLIDVINK